MPILKPSQRPEKEQIRIYISSEIKEQMEAYCEWAGIRKIDEFIEQAAELILQKDKEWGAFKGDRKAKGLKKASNAD